MCIRQPWARNRDVSPSGPLLAPSRRGRERRPPGRRPATRAMSANEDQEVSPRAARACPRAGAVPRSVGGLLSPTPGPGETRFRTSGPARALAPGADGAWLGCHRLTGALRAEARRASASASPPPQFSILLSARGRPR